MAAVQRGPPDCSCPCRIRTALVQRELKHIGCLRLGFAPSPASSERLRLRRRIDGLCLGGWLFAAGAVGAGFGVVTE